METTHAQARIPTRTLARIALLALADAALLAARADAQYGPLLYDSVVYGAGGAPSALVVTDLNQDSRVDAAFVTAGSHRLGVWVNAGNGTLDGGGSYELGAASVPQAIVAGDFDDDGRIELAIALAGTNAVQIMLPSDPGFFGFGGSYPVGANPRSLAIGDFDGDGHLDLVTANQDVDGVSVLLGVGDNTFGGTVGFDAGDAPRAVVVGDWNGDGAADLATANESADAIAILLGAGDGSFASPTVIALGAGSAPAALATADLDAGGTLDLAVALRGDDAVAVLLGNGDGSFAGAASLAVGDAPSAVVATDLSGDGLPDLATANHDDATASVLVGSGGGSFGAAAAHGVGSGPVALVVPLVNADERPDLVVLSQDANSFEVLFGEGDGDFGSNRSYPAGPAGCAPRAVAVADLDTDGEPDLAVANDGNDTVTTLLGAGDGSFALRGSVGTGSSPQSIAAGDFDENGEPDVVVANLDSDSVSVLLGAGDGSLVANGSVAVMDGPNSVVVADVDGDGHEDVITANMNADTVSVRLGAGDGSFPGGGNYGVDDEPHSVAVGVLAGVGDDSPDLVTAGHADGVITVLEGVGDGSFVYSGTYILSDANGPEVVVLGEWGNDDGLDVAVSIAWGDVRILVNYDGKFGLAHGSGCGAEPLGLAAAQLEPGGWSELVTANGVNESTTMLWGGTSNWTYGAGKAPRGVATGDFDGDGRPDVVTADSGSDSVTVLLNRSLSEGYPWFNVGYPLAGVDGDPLLTGLGNLQPGSAGHLKLSHAKPNARVALCASAGIAATPFKGGYLWPTPVQLFFLGVVSSQGELVLPWSSWQAGLSGHSVFLEYIIDDHAAVHHIALSNALRMDVP